MSTASNLNYEIERLEQQLSDTVSDTQQQYIRDKLRVLYAQLD